MNENRGIWRGKLIDEDEQLDRNKWVEGFLAKRTKSYAKIVDDEDMVRYADPETLGECTGLPDKNHKIIFEGDIVKTLEIDIYGEQRCFPVVCVKGAFWLYDKYLDGNDGLDFLASYEEEAIEVVGNIYDNPELLEDGENNV